jgi:hypothetical protein
MNNYNKYHLSFSSICAFHKGGPQGFISYKERDDDNQTDATGLGSMVHTRFLENDKVSERYVVSDRLDPTGKVFDFIHAYADCQDFETAYLKSGFKWTREKVFEIMQEPANLEYITWLIDSKGKAVISSKQNKVIEKLVIAAKKHKLANQLIFTQPFETETDRNVEIHNELTIDWMYPKTRFRVRGMIDRLIVSHELKKVWIVDLKTTSTPISSFVRSVEKYRYDWQVVMYTLAVAYWLKAKGLDPGLYTPMNNHIVIAQTTGFHEVDVRYFTRNQLLTAKSSLELEISKLQYHFENDLWSHSRDYYEGDGSQPFNYAGK